MLLIEKHGAVAVVTLNRPEKMNALSRALRSAIGDAFVEIGRDDSIKAAILTGAGERAFSAGVDLKEMGSGPIQSMADGGAAEDPVRAMKACGKPVIGAINGVAITGGFELALACDVLVCSETARFADTHARVGVLPGWGLSQKLPRTIGIYRAKELSLTGNFLDAQTAYDWGLVNRVVPANELMPTALKLAQDMAQIDLDMLVTYKAVIDDGYEMVLSEALEMEITRGDAHNMAMDPGAVEARRADVQARGRTQG